MTVINRTISTSYAEIAISETSGSGLPLLMLHGNSSCKEVFSNQLNSEIGEKYRLIAMDLPGHGASSRAVNPQSTYSWPGYAVAATELLEEMGVSNAAVYGWSLGGQIGIEMLRCYPGIVGLMISGAPPIRPDMESIQQGFKASPALMLAGQEIWTDDEFQVFGDTVFGELEVPELRDAGRRTHGAARRFLLESLIAGKASDQRALVKRSKVPIAVVNGERDPLVNLDYIGGLSYSSLWDEHCYILRGLGHVPFLQSPDVFNPLLGRFMVDMERGARAKTNGAHAIKTAAA
jgi:pimeloyl-ACP methyl ester carboxylesterase